MKSLRKWIVVSFAALALTLVGVSPTRADDMPFGFSVKSEPAETAKGETVRMGIYNTKNEKVSLKIQYGDGRQELRSLRPDGSTNSLIVWDAKGKRTLEKEFYPDGKLMRELQNGVLRFERRKLADGTFEAIRYKSDGKRAQMLRRVGPNGGFELTHYRTGKSDAIWFRSNGNGTSGNFEWEYFGEDGTRVRRIVRDNDMVVTVLDKSGALVREQVWVTDKDGNWTVKSVAVPHAGKQRRYVVEGGKVVRAEDLGLDGEVKRTLKADELEAIDSAHLKEHAEDDDPTIPEPVKVEKKKTP